MTAQFMNQVRPEPLSQFSKMGQPVSFATRQRGYDSCKEMGLQHTEAFDCVQAVSDLLERDKPYEAMQACMKWLDLTGTYRLFATLLS